MGLFDKWKTNKVTVEAGTVCAPMNGSVIPLEQIPDQVFSQGVLGPGCGMEPEDGELVAPFKGRIISIADTKHAIGIQSDDGIELLIHVGMDTVQMNGDGFDVKVKEGDRVTPGQLLMRFDMEKIKNAGYPATTAVVVTNGNEFQTVEFPAAEHKGKTEVIGRCRK